MKRLFLILLTVGVSHLAQAIELPANYRLPTKEDIKEDWITYKAPNHIISDFNDDGIKDEAWILPKSESSQGFGVFAYLKKRNKSSVSGRDYQLFKLAEYDDLFPQNFAIELVKPSAKPWESACGKGYRDCEVGEPAEFKITKPSIMFCAIESACTVFLWDSKNQVFSKIDISD